MTQLSPFANLNQQDTQSALMFLLSELIDKLPRPDDRDRLMISWAEATGGTLAAVTTVTTVSTVSAVSRVDNFGAIGGIAPASAVPIHLANMGASIIYSNIKVT